MYFSALNSSCQLIEKLLIAFQLVDMSFTKHNVMRLKYMMSLGYTIGGVHCFGCITRFRAHALFLFFFFHATQNEM